MSRQTPTVPTLNSDPMVVSVLEKPSIYWILDTKQKKEIYVHFLGTRFTEVLGNNKSIGYGSSAVSIRKRVQPRGGFRLGVLVGSDILVRTYVRK